MLRGHDPGTCCSDTSPRVSSYFRATRILLQFCPRDMSHEVQLVELCGTCCRDKTLQGCDVPSCALLCNAFMQQNQHFSLSQTTTRIFRALSLGKKTTLIGIDKKAYYCINDVDGRIRTCCCETERLVPSMLASPRRTTRISHNFQGVGS